MYINTVIILTVTALLFMVFWFTPLRRKWFSLNKPVIEPLQKKGASCFTSAVGSGEDGGPVMTEAATEQSSIDRSIVGEAVSEKEEAEYDITKKNTDIKTTKEKISKTHL